MDHNVFTDRECKEYLKTAWASAWIWRWAMEVNSSWSTVAMSSPHARLDVVRRLPGQRGQQDDWFGSSSHVVSIRWFSRKDLSLIHISEPTRLALI
eukprot:10958183-Alexandrium_andersonii.AAC.1